MYGDGELFPKLKELEQNDYFKNRMVPFGPFTDCRSISLSNQRNPVHSSNLLL